MKGLDSHGVVIDCGPCPYLPGRTFRAFHLIDEAIDDGSYRRLLDRGFRRSGEHFYAPVCESCGECRPLRVDAPAFRERRDQRRCRARNRDLAVSWQPRAMDDDRHALFARYQAAVHDDPFTSRRDAAAFLIRDGGVPGGELHARDAGGRLLAVSVCDVVGDALSSVYCYYDPDQPRRSLGTFMALAEIDHCRRAGLRWLYLGFLVRGCRKMLYKSRFRPNEVLEPGGWTRYE